MKYIFTSGNTKILQDRRTIQSIVGSFLQSHGHSVSMLKIEDHLNYDLRNTDLRHRGEVFVLSDGCEADLSLGAFERGCGVLLTRDNYLTLGKILFQITRREMVGGPGTELLGMYPAVEKYLRSHIVNLSNKNVQVVGGDSEVPDFLIVDVGELLFGSSPSPLRSAIMKFIALLDSSNLVLMNIDVADEVSEAEMHATTSRVSECYDGVDIKNGVLSFLISEKRGRCCVFKTSSKPWSCDVLYQVGTLDYARIFGELRGALLLDMAGDAEPEDGAGKVKKAKTTGEAPETVRIGIVADLDQKYNPYLSVEDTLVHAGLQHGLCVDIRYIYFSAHEDDGESIPLLLEGVSGVVLPGGFGSQMVEKKLALVKCARENNVPFLGICLGFQLAIIEFARSVLGIPDATSREFDPRADHPIICRVQASPCANTARRLFLGAYSVECRGEALDIYKKDVVEQRFRHRYALENSYKGALEEKGMQLIGKTTHDRIVIFKLKDHRFFAGVQYHPELGSAYASIDPIISAFVREAAAKGGN